MGEEIVIGLLAFSQFAGLVFLIRTRAAVGTQCRQIGRLQVLLEASLKRTSATDQTLQAVEKLLLLDQKVAAKLKKLEKPDTTASEIIEDITRYGATIVRIHPESIYIRGIRD